MIIKCPNCERRFDLQRKAPTTFHCPKCGYKTPFTNVLNAEKDTGISSVMDDSEPNAIDGPRTKVVQEIDSNLKTQMVSGLQQGNYQDKTRVVESLQQKKGAALQVMNSGQVVKTVSIMPGRHTIGRQSSDSKATIKLSPDISMSRIHAYLSSVTSPQGDIQYILKPANQHNPIYVNDRPIAFGTAALLRPGDIIVMGNTTVIFRK